MYKVLLVDDEFFVLNGLKKLILSYSSEISEIVTAQNGEEALASMQQSAADIVFTDIKMPGMDGIELIERLVKANIACKIIILSGYDSFSYAQKAIANNIKAYLLKPIIKNDLENALLKVITELKTEATRDKHLQLLQQQLESSLPILKEKFFCDMANGHYQKDMAEFLQLNYSCDSYKIVLLSPDYPAAQSFSPSLLEKEKQLTLLRISNQIKQSLSVVELDYFYLEHRICLLLNLKSDQNNNFLELLFKNWQNDMLEKSNISFSLGISGLFDKIEDFSVYLEQAFTALNHKLFIGESSLVFYENIYSTEIKHVYINSSQIKNELYQALMEDSYDKVISLLDANKKDLFSRLSYPSAMIKTICLDILSIFSIFAFEQGIDPKELLFDEHMPSEKVFRSDTIDEIFSIIYKTHDKICVYLRQKSAKLNFSTINTIKKYVSDHIEEDVSLDALSNVVYLTPNYISALFKRETELSFKKYVLTEKMRRAKVLLSENKLKIYEVAEAVGYKSVPYFSKTFKKATGVYPSDYRPNQNI